MQQREVEMSPTGALNFKLPQQKWCGDEQIQSSYFSGQPMLLKQSEQEEGVFELHYLGLKVSGFEDMDEAKFNAPEFVKSVFQILSEFVKDHRP